LILVKIKITNVCDRDRERETETERERETETEGERVKWVFMSKLCKCESRGLTKHKITQFKLIPNYHKTTSISYTTKYLIR